MPNKSELIIYQTEDHQTAIQVQFEDDTVWLTQQQMATLFAQTKQNISLHINNCFKEGELERNSAVKESLTTASDGKKYSTSFYNLDVIISIGYRIKSKRGTQFRQWASQRLKEYLIEGYSVNQKRLAERNLELKQLKEGISILHRAIEQQAESLTEAGNLAALLAQFAQGLVLLDDYDHETLDAKGKTKFEGEVIAKSEYLALIEAMKDEFASDIFGQERGGGFDSAINQIYQSFGGTDLYPTLEEKAATLLYLVVKNHAFVDGNKRIAAACFLYFLQKNGLLNRDTGNPIISNEALASITLFVAVSKPDEMDTVKRVVISILNRGQ